MSETVFCRNALRPSRLHTEKGDFAIKSSRDIADASIALLTTALRVGLGYRIPRPWIAANALRALRKRVSTSWRVFEWGSGMSTLRYERHCAEVHAVEDNSNWY